MNRIITYAVHRDDGLVISRVGSELAWPVLQYDAMLPENNFTPTYALERINVSEARHEWRMLKWTKKIPVELKNRHRTFWGLPALHAKAVA